MKEFPSAIVHYLNKIRKPLIGKFRNIISPCWHLTSAGKYDVAFQDTFVLMR